MRLNRRAAIALAAILLAFPAQAHAGAPIVIGPAHEEGVEPIADCGSFDVLDEYSIDYVLRVHVDANGDPIRGVEQVQGTDTFVNSVTGKRIPTKFANSVKIDFEAGLGATSGIIYRVTVPGMGAVFLDVGRIVTNQSGDIVAFRAGPHQFFDADFSRLCAALA